METLELNCEPRALSTRGAVRELRRRGQVPGVMYGPKRSPIALAVAAAGLKAGALGNTSQRLLRLKSASAELDGRHVIVKEVQRDALAGRLLHADFYEVDLNAKIRVPVPLRFSGRAKGVVDGGILQPLERSVEVECLPLEIPEAVEVDVTEIGIHEAIHVSALKFGANIRALYDTDYPIVTVLPPTVEAAPAPAEAAAEAAPAEGAPAVAASEAPVKKG
ncbi:MAG TPA: 50S ribosomal protein L25 [Candidatus Binataceae bacterium]|nr:50S ribosomal protein L25 [Candidatus Binataceae bacterium]